MKFTADEMKNYDCGTNIGPNNTYVCARPENYKFESWKYRLLLAWKVFIGKYDALEWYKQ